MSESILSPAVHINRITTAVPRFEGHQKFLNFLPILVSAGDLKLVKRLAARAQIERRYTVLTPSPEPHLLDAEDFFTPGRFASTARRMRRYDAEALPLAACAVSELLTNEKLDADAITHLIITTCTGFSAPGLDLQLQRHFEMRSDLQRTVIGFMGCYAAITGLRSATQIVRADPLAKVLMVNLELCSLHLQEDGDPEKILGFLQFADGCAASLISADARGLEVKRFRSEALADRADLITWHVGDAGFEMFLSGQVPKALGEALPGLLPRILTAAERAQMRLWAVHPGGRAILDAVRDHLEVTETELASSRQVLRDYGNMSSATVMFVLKAMLENPAQTGLGLALAFGPGLTVESLLFSKESKS